MSPGLKFHEFQHLGRVGIDDDRQVLDLALERQEANLARRVALLQGLDLVLLAAVRQQQLIERQLPLDDFIFELRAGR